MAPCSHVWHYKCIRPILNDHKNFPHFLCPNCRAVTDLEADLDDRLDEWWEDAQDAVKPKIDEPMNEIILEHGIQAETVTEQRDTEMNGVSQDLSLVASQSLSTQEGDNISPSMTTATDPSDNVTPSSNLLDRRNAAVTEQGGIRMPSEHIQYLRPITPPQPQMEDGNLDRPKLHTPTMDMLVSEGPMTPTNTAGPFVFDGGAGRASARRSLSDEASLHSMTHV